MARKNPTKALNQVANTALLGRGRGDGQTDTLIAEGWSDTRDANGDPVVVINANESDPVACGDRTLLEGAPIDVLDGALVVAAIVGSEDIVIYLNENDNLAARRIREAKNTITEVDLAGDVSIDFVTRVS